ncbi:MAG: hypothetical protein ACHQY1_00665 [Myxococcota bacterium]
MQRSPDLPHLSGVRRILISMAIITTVVSVTPAVAGAGGGSWIRFDGPLIVGTVVTGRGSFGGGQQSTLDAGPWFAWLRPEEPGVAEMRLGPVEVHRASSYVWGATVSFTVPDVPTGEYWVDVVNADGEGVGALDGGFGVISRTPLEGRLWSRAQRAEGERARSDRAIAELQRRQAQLEAIVLDRQATIERQAERLTAAGARITGLEADLAPTTSSNATWPLAGVTALLLALVGFALGRRYATRTLVTGASRSWAENQDAPASAEPNTSPLVAPK